MILPATFRNHHFRSQLMELFPQIFPFQRHFGIVDDAVVFRLNRSKRPYHSWMVTVSGNSGCSEHHVLRSGVRMPGQCVMRVWMVDFGDQCARVTAVRILSTSEGCQCSCREITTRIRIRRRRRWRLIGVCSGQKRGYTEICLPWKLQKWVICHSPVNATIHLIFLPTQLESHLERWRWFSVRESSESLLNNCCSSCFCSCWSPICLWLACTIFVVSIFQNNNRPVNIFNTTISQCTNHALEFLKVKRNQK